MFGVGDLRNEVAFFVKLDPEMVDKFFLFLFVLAVFLDEFVSAADVFLEFLDHFFELDDFELLDFE